MKILKMFVVFLTGILLKHFLAASTEEENIFDAINKQNWEVKRQKEEVMTLLDKIVT